MIYVDYDQLVTHCTHKELPETEQEEAGTNTLACESQDPSQASQNLCQARQNEQPSEEQRYRPTPYGDVDIDGTGRQVAYAQCQ
jgi:hypothetical protein